MTDDKKIIKIESDEDGNVCKKELSELVEKGVVFEISFQKFASKLINEMLNERNNKT